MNMNILLTNGFVKGMNMDIDISAITDTQYKYAENVRVIADKDGTNGVLLNILDTRLVSGGDFLSQLETILYALTTSEYAVILTVDLEGISRIYRVWDHNNLPLKYKVIVKGRLGYHEDSNVKIVANYESDTNIKIYIVDGENTMKFLNIMDDRYVYVPGQQNDALDQFGNLKDPNAIDQVPSSILQAPLFVDLGSGSLMSGMVQYAYQLFNARGSSTTISPVSGMIHLTSSSTSNDLNDYKGDEKEKNTGKSAIINIPISYGSTDYSSYYDRARIYRIFYNDNTETPKVSVLDEIRIALNSLSVTYEDIGNDVTNVITMEEFNALQNTSFVASTIEKKDNILFAAGIKQNEWSPEFDARAYRYTKAGQLVLKSSNAAYDISYNMPAFGSLEERDLLLSIDKDHDCINPYNQLKGKPKDTDCLFSNEIEYGTRVLGGSGANVSYRFVTTDIDLDTMGYIARDNVDPLEEYANIQVQARLTRDLDFQYLDSKLFAANVSIPEKRRQVNYADPYIDANFRGYLRDEIYRFGIIFYNSKSIASTVFWIGDIRMPHPAQYCGFYADNNLQGKILGLQFKVKNAPEDAVSYEIVRCKRTADDRTVVTQGIMSEITNYPYKYINQGDELGNNKDYRPRIPLGYTDQDVKYSYLRGLVGSILPEEQTGYRLDSKITRDYAVLISPELDIVGERTLDNFDNTYADLAYYLNSRMLTEAIRDHNNDLYVKPFISTDQTVVSFTNERRTNSRTIGKVNQSYRSLILACEETSNNSSVHTVTNLISKKYIPYYGTNDTITPDLNNNAIFPQVMEQNAITNKIAFYKSIGDISYLNLGHVINDRLSWSSGVSRTGYFGTCAVINGGIGAIPRFHNIRSSSVLGNSYVQQKAATGFAFWDVPVVNIKRNIVPYGGNSYNARINSTYISTNSYSLLDDENSSVVYGGDTYMGILDHKTASVFPDPGNAGDVRSQAISCTDYIPFETSINLALQYGDTTSRSVEGMLTYSNVYLSNTITGGTQGSYNIQSKPYYAYNDVYSSQQGSRFYVPEALYSITNANNINRVLQSNIKTNNEITDSWVLFKYGNYLDVDSQHGKITNLRSFNDRLFFWQDKSFGILSVNDRALIQDNNLSTLTLGTGGVLPRYDYLTTGNGSSVINDKSIVNSDSVLYWYDVDKNEICAFGQSVLKLSKTKSVLTYLNNLTNKKVHDSLYDSKFNEILMCFNDSVLVFNEYIDAYTSFYTYNPDSHLTFSDKLFYIKNNTITENADFALSKMLSKVLFIINKDITYTKTFDNVFFAGEFSDIKSQLKPVTFTTKNQIGSINEDYIDGGYAIDYREDTYRFAIGREESAEDDMSYAGRLKGKYLICDYTINCDDQKYFRLPHINTTYRYSLT